MKYVSLEDLLTSPHLELPQTLDSIDFTYRDVKFHVYGILHGITGGTNRAYKRFVNQSIAAAPGLKLAEKGFRDMYKGFDGEVHDWLQMPFWDSFKLGATPFLTPFRMAKYLGHAARELLTSEDRFPERGMRRLQNIGGSPAFHLLDPWERRRLAGFPAPQQYLEINLGRRVGSTRFAAPVFPDRTWDWLTDMEPHANIALRSVHQLEFAAETALLRGVQEVSLFVGEVHNIDIAWAGTTEIPKELRETLDQVKHAARTLAHSTKLRLRMVQYELAFSLGMVTPPAVYLLLARLAQLAAT